METLILIANPGSVSRKYALFSNNQLRAALHFEYENSEIICTLIRNSRSSRVPIELKEMHETTTHIIDILRNHDVLSENEKITHIGLRIVAPSSYFLDDRLADDEMVRILSGLESRAPLHISATLAELHGLREMDNNTKIIGISDSAFHITKPNYAWNYGLPIHDADRLDIKRFGYHGLSVSSAMHSLQQAGLSAPKVIVCHLGGGASITAVYEGKSVDNTMGYSPLEGVVMATRSGSIDPTAVRALKDLLELDDAGVEEYLQTNSGLLGLGGASDVRELLRWESDGSEQAHLALQTYIYNIQKAIGQMTAALGGVDMLVFTGTIGERSVPIRERILERLHYLDFTIDGASNTSCIDASRPTVISTLANSKPIYVVNANEANEMVRRINEKFLGV